MGWHNKELNYWENPDCRIEYLEGALVRLIDEVEGVTLPSDYFSGKERAYIADKVAFYEYLLDK